MPLPLSQWLGKIAAGAISPGQSFTVDHGGGYLCESRVLEHVPRRTLVYTWKFPDEPRSKVSWVLSHTDDVTSVQLTHTDLGHLVGAYRDGWITHLTFLEAAALEAPLPLTMFWHLHDTIALLNGKG